MAWIRWISRHKVITALVITFVVVPIFVGIFNAAGASLDLGTIVELTTVGWIIYGLIWLIFGYPKRKRHKAHSKGK